MNPTPTDVLHAVEQGKITQREADIYLRAVHKTTLAKAQGRKSTAIYSIITVVVLALIAGLLYLPGSPTGLVTLDTAQNATDASVQIIEPVSRLRTTGTMYGEGDARLLFETETGTLTIATIQSDTGVPRTAQASYAPGEEITLEHADGASVYLDDGTSTVPITLPYPAPAVGEYELLVVMDVNGEPTSTRAPLLVSETPLERTTTFTNVCEETCVLDGVVGTVTLITQGTRVDYTLDGTSAVTNEPPQLTQTFEDLTVTENTTIDLAEHFADPEGEVLLFSTSTSQLATLSLEGTALTIIPLREGREEITIYASDLNEIVQASFEIVVSPPRSFNDTTQNETNTTVPEDTTSPNTTVPEQNETNVTIPETETNTTNVTQTSLDCSSSNPNERPLSCLQENAQEYFPDEDIYWMNLDRTPVAKLNELGNILITGGINEFSTDAPGSRDFIIGTQDRDGVTIPSVWIDTEGNLHARGAIIEEQLQLNPPSGSYSVISKRSIYLVYVEYASGNLYVRGNIIPYRRQI